MPEAFQTIPKSADRTHKMQAEVIEARLSLARELSEFGMAADADPHGLDCTPEGS
jgi:hypothetical protein